MARSLQQVGENVWEIRVFVGRDANGRVRHRHARVKGTKRVANRALENLVAEVRTAPEPVVVERTLWGAETTLNDAFEAWKKNGWQDLSPSTIRRYESIWTVHVAGSIGRTRISKLGSYELETYFRPPQVGRSRGGDRSPDESDPQPHLPTGASVERRRSPKPRRGHRVAELEPRRTTRGSGS